MKLATLCASSLLLLLLQAPPPAAAQATGPGYGGRVVVDASAGAAVHDELEAELVRWLGEMSGAPFSLELDSDYLASGGVAPGILLLLEDSPTVQQLAPAPLLAGLADLETRSAPAYLVYSEGTDRLWVVGRSDHALSHGAFDLLERLGCRFLLPADHWTIVPTRSDVTLPGLDEVVEPDLQVLEWAGNGGWGTHHVMEDYFDVKAAWLRWARRLRAPRTFWVYGGHSYQLFVEDEQPAIEADPLMLPEVGGQRVPYPATSKLRSSTKLHYTHHGTIGCDAADAVVSHSEAVGCGTDAECGEGTCDALTGTCEYCESLDDWDSGTATAAPSDMDDGGVVRHFALWTRARAEQQLDPTYSKFIPDLGAVSVDPSDSGGHCECDKCRSLLHAGGPYGHLSDDDSSVSDRVFHLANHAARHVAAVDPDVRVSLLAYSHHAAPPTIPLEPNMLVYVVDGYNGTGLTDEELLAAWGDKQASNPLGPFRLGARDYWCLTEHYFDLPTANCSVERIVDKLRGWHAAGADVVEIETSYSGAAAGLPLYVASRLAWDMDADVDALVDEFFDLGFGQAAAPVRAMMTRWQSGVPLNAQELAASFRDVSQALALAPGSGDPDVVARVDDLAAYVQYLRLRLEALEDTDHADRWTALYEWVWATHHRLMTHTVRLGEVLDDASELPASWFDAWDEEDALAAAWQGLPDFGVGSPKDRVVDGVKDYPLLPLTTAAAWDAPVPLEAPQAGTIVWTQKHNGRSRWAAAADATFTVTIETYGGDPPSKPLAQPRLDVIGPDGDPVLAGVVLPVERGAWLETDLSVPVAVSGIYTLELEAMSSANRYRFAVDSSVALGGLPPYRHRFAPLSAERFFHVPEGVDLIALYADGVDDANVVFLSPVDLETPAPHTTYGPSLHVLDTSGYEFRVFGVRGLKSVGKSTIEFLNIPTVFALRPDHVMVAASPQVEHHTTPRFVSDHTLAVQAQGASVDLSVTVDRAATSGGGDLELTVLDADGAVVWLSELPAAAGSVEQHDLVLPAPSPGVLRLVFDAPADRSVGYRVAAATTAQLVDIGAYGLPPVVEPGQCQWVRVGSDKQTLLGRVEGLVDPPQGWWSDDPATPIAFDVLGGGVFEAEVEGRAGAWCLTGLPDAGDLQLMNVPQVVAFGPDPVSVDGAWWAWADGPLEALSPGAVTAAVTTPPLRKDHQLELDLAQAGALGLSLDAVTKAVPSEIAVTLTDLDGAVVGTATLPVGASWTETVLPLTAPSPGRYGLRVASAASTTKYRLTVPEHVRLVDVGDYAMVDRVPSAKQHFHVPEGRDHLFVRSPSVTPMSFHGPNGGAEAPIQLTADLWMLEVAGDHGVWAVSGQKAWAFELLNVPQAIAFRAEDVMVPAP